jgi:hypothetical protein
MAAGTDLVDELRAIWDRVPIPRETWHPWGESILRLDRDVRAALAIVAEDADALAALAQVLAEEDAAPAGKEGAVAEALRRLGELPRPDGKHPYLGDVLPGLEAAEALLTAVSRSPAASSRFAAHQPSDRAAARPAVPVARPS